MGSFFFRTVALSVSLPATTIQSATQFDSSMSTDDFKGLIRRVAPDQSDFADQVVSIRPYHTANSGSGAAFFLVALADDPKSYFFKCDVPGSRIVSGEATAYLALAKCGLDGLYLTPKALSVAAPAFIAMEYLRDSITTFDLLMDPKLSGEIPTVFNRGMGQFLRVFLEKQSVCKDPEKWFQEYTIGRALDPVFKQWERAKVGMDPPLLPTTMTFSKLIETPVALIDGVMVPNGLKFLSAMGNDPRFGPNPQDPYLQNTLAIMRHILFARYTMTTVTDPNLLNELVVLESGKPRRVVWVDPGRVEEVQLSVPLIKGMGQFAQILGFMLRGEVTSGIESNRRRCDRRILSIRSPRGSGVSTLVCGSRIGFLKLLSLSIR